MAVYQHKATGDRVRPSPGDPYERLLRKSPHYELVDAEGDAALQKQLDQAAEAPAPPKARTTRKESDQ